MAKKWSEKVNGNTWHLASRTIPSGTDPVFKLRDSVSYLLCQANCISSLSSISADNTDLNTSNNLRIESIEVVGSHRPQRHPVTPKGQGKRRFVDSDQNSQAI
ncbi:MAG: hypothetical protein IPL08_17210 [Saprospiraceae bacterium]|nr:hypothetical protein [Saprospiraceae bacterium]